MTQTLRDQRREGSFGFKTGARQNQQSNPDLPDLDRGRNQNWRRMSRMPVRQLRLQFHFEKQRWSRNFALLVSRPELLPSSHFFNDCQCLSTRLPTASLKLKDSCDRASQTSQTAKAPPNPPKSRPSGVPQNSAELIGVPTVTKQQADC